ncbi:MAG: F0F1 ATP synthase subunit A [Flavobacteriales bacterium]|nr:F0F1 ATP synthase subunit A [Flavobacteriales bacterium]
MSFMTPAAACMFSVALASEHGHAAYDGYKLDDGKVIAVDTAGHIDEAGSKAIWDISITKNVVSIFLVMILLVLMFSSIARSYAKRVGQAPKGLQSFMEPIILFVRDDVAKGAIGPHKYQRFMPYLLTIFFVILFANLIGLIPFPGGRRSPATSPSPSPSLSSPSSSSR